MNIHTKRIDLFRAWIKRIAPQINAGFSLRIWNGEILPLGNEPASDILLCINSDEAITRLIYKPKLTTVFELYYENIISIEGGTPLEMMRKWNHLGVVKSAKTLGKVDLIRTFWPFLIKTNWKPKGRLAYQSEIKSKASDGRDDVDYIQFHYDLSNKFYNLFLGDSMVYTSAYFQSYDTSLSQAQFDKLDIICKKLRLQENERFLDIGCGWGSLICHAAQYYGVKAHGVTLSQAQYDYAQEMIKRLGLEDKVVVELRDYRDLQGSGVFDKIAQVEMFEHVGFDNHEQYFKKINNLLRSRGLYLHQGITLRPTKKPTNYKKSSQYLDVLEKYIFPGAEIDYLGNTINSHERHAFEVHDVENLREHYQLTLEHWVNNLARNRDEAVKEVGEEKVRAWLLAFSGFAFFYERGGAYVHQILSSKRRTGASGLPLTRNDLYR